MKIVYAIGLFWLVILCSSLISSCSNTEIEELEKKIEELEAQLNQEDSVFLGDLEIINQESMDIMVNRKITNILGTLHVRNCTDLSPLMGLKSVEGLIIEAPTGLISLQGLNNLTAANFLKINFNSSTIDLSALDSLKTVEDIQLTGEVPSGSFFNKIESLKSIHIIIYGESIDFELSGFEDLMSIEFLYIDNIQGNIWMEGFNNLHSILDLNVSANRIDISGFSNVRALNSLIVVGTQLSGLNDITSLDYFSINGDSINISGLINLKILGALDVFAESSVTGLNGLESIEYNLRLDIANSNNFLTSLTTTGTLILYSESNTITSFATLELSNLESIKGLIINHASLESLDGIPFTSSLLDQFIIFNSLKLIDLTELSAFNGTIDYVELYSTGLTSFSGFRNVTNINSLSIHNNKQLSNWCDIKGIFDSIPTRDIRDNLVNPNNAGEITGCE